MARPAAGPRAGRSLESIICFVLMVALAALVIYPIFLLVRDAFYVTAKDWVLT